MSNTPWDGKDPNRTPPNPFSVPQPGVNNPQMNVPRVPGPLPQVILWQQVYLGFMTALYLLVIVAGVMFAAFSEEIAADDPTSEPFEFVIMGCVFGGIGLVFAGLFASGFFIRKGGFGWGFNLVLIGIGLTSCCFWPACIPLLVFWIKNRDDIIYYS